MIVEITIYHEYLLFSRFDFKQFFIVLNNPKVTWITVIWLIVRDYACSSRAGRDRDVLPNFRKLVFWQRLNIEKEAEGGKKKGGYRTVSRASLACFLTAGV
jgi:hypothetical protein